MATHVPDDRAVKVTVAVADGGVWPRRVAARRCVGSGVEARQGSVVTLKGCLARPKSTKGEVGHLGSGVGCAKDGGSREKEARHRLYFWKNVTFS